MRHIGVAVPTAIVLSTVLSFAMEVRAQTRIQVLDRVPGEFIVTLDDGLIADDEARKIESAEIQIRDRGLSPAQELIEVLDDRRLALRITKMEESTQRSVVVELSGESFLLSGALNVCCEIAAVAVETSRPKTIEEARLKIVPVSDEAEARASLAGHGAGDAFVEIQPNYVYRADEYLPPEDPRIADMWHLENAQILEGWRTITGSPKVTVAIIDTGIDIDHVELKDNIWQNPTPSDLQDTVGYDFYNGDNDPRPDIVPRILQSAQDVLLVSDTEGLFEEHGTHVAGIVGAIANNEVGGAGVTWKVNILPIKAFGGPESKSTTTILAKAIRYAVERGANIINASWGVSPIDSKEDVVLREALEYANSSGVLIVAAAGNAGNDIDAKANYPASFELDNIVAVAATDEGNNLAQFRSASSNFGLKSVDVAAPGYQILSALPDSRLFFRLLGQEFIVPEARSLVRTGRKSGTSMAAPIVSGFAALVMAKFPALDHVDVKKKIVESVDILDSLSGKVQSSGLVNLSRAVQ